MNKLITVILLGIILAGLLCLRSTWNRMEAAEWLAQRTNPDQFEFQRCIPIEEFRGAGIYKTIIYIPAGSWMPLGDSLCEVQIKKEEIEQQITGASHDK